ncbi:MAG: M1 family metallopeptidase [Gemmatimonadaceae bacterium]|nr:M1 family metallopeptidase [Gemmatimonadaceae bacterium]
MMIAILPFLFALQQGVTATSSPPSGDTIGYWQQRADYRITAKLDEAAQVLHGKATLTYVNHSPDTLRELRVQQLLNAFRPGSRWSAADEREGRVRFQRLREPNYGYERFTAPPRVNGAPVAVTYPFAPDSTIARFDLPAPLAPGDSAIVEFAWDARPSATIYRRQGRRGRKYDFSQWYPKVAVYDRGGWEAQPFIPNGEMYGEFGTFDVTLDLAADQVVGATGVPVAGDPGWEKAKSWGEVHLARDAYGAVDTTLPALPPGRKAVRFYARDVHHFGWAVDPEFRYEGALYRGAIPIHVLITPAEMAKLGHGTLVTWNEHALEFLEKIYGPYGYPQLTALIRLDPGATEFPMMAMYGDPSEGTVSHEVGHIYSYGMLANNEWREGWMDEGLTSYQSEWRIRETPQDIAKGAPQEGPAPATGYRAHAHVMSAVDRNRVALYDVDLLGRAQAPESPSHSFNEFNLYQMAVYSRPDLMYGMLRDMIGDSAFTAFLHDYYARWKFKHVDELAMRASAERISGRDLGWFFAQWVHRTGLVDYALAGVETRRDGSGWLTRARVVRRGEYRHAMPVGARADGAWAIARADPARDGQWVEMRTAKQPDDVRLDPLHSTEDWDRRNDAHDALGWFHGRGTMFVPDWPFLAQTDRDRNLVAVGPKLWYTGPGGVTGAVRLRSNYSAVGDLAIDRRELGIALSSRVPDGAPGIEHLQGWATIANPRLPFSARPSIGLSAGAWLLDGITKLELAKEWNLSPFLYSNGPQRRLRVGLDATLPYDTRWMDFARWQPEDVYDANAEYSWRARMPSSLRARVRGIAGVSREVGDGSTRAFERIEGEAAHTGTFGAGDRWTHKLRLFAGASNHAPLQRSIGLASLDATDSYGDDLVRGRDALFARSDVHVAIPGGAGLRGYSPLLRVDDVAALNGELAASVVRARPTPMVPSVHIVAFGDAAYGTLQGSSEAHIFADAGVGVLARDQLWDRTVTVRFDVPLYVRFPALAPGGTSADNNVRLRWTFSFADLW